MALRTGDQYRQGQEKIKHNVYIDGKKVENLEANPNTKTVLDATAKVFDLGMDPQYDEIMNVVSPLVQEKVSRNVHPARSTRDLEMRAEMGLLTAQKLNTTAGSSSGSNISRRMIWRSAVASWMSKVLGISGLNRMTLTCLLGLLRGVLMALC
jgi:aromatic ring hydroxylase